jgi:hypothetical protein
LNALYRTVEGTADRLPEDLNESTAEDDSAFFEEGFSTHSPLPPRSPEWRQADNRLVVHCMAAMASNCEFDPGKFRNLLFHECLETSDVQATPTWWEEIQGMLDDFGPLTLSWNDKKKKPSRENMGLDSEDMTALRSRCGASLFPYVYIFFLMRFMGPQPDTTKEFTGWEVLVGFPTVPKNDQSAWTKAGFTELYRTLKIMLRLPDYPEPEHGVVTKHWVTRIFAWAFTVSLFPKMSTSVTLAETSEECFVAEHINSVATLVWRLLPKQRTRDGWFQGLLDMKVYDATGLTPNDIQLESEDVLDGINAKLGEARSAHLRPALIHNGEHALARVDLLCLCVGMKVFHPHAEGTFRVMRIISEIVMGISPSIKTTLLNGTDPQTSILSEWDEGEEDPGCFEDARQYLATNYPEVRFPALDMLCACAM